MTPLSETRDRGSLRLKDYDYSSAGAYFLTLCIHDRECLLGEVANGEVCLSRFGQIVADEWVRSADIRTEISLDVFVVMPNHFHGIVCLSPVACGDGYTVGAHGRAPLQRCAPLQGGAPLRRPPRSLGSFVAGFKSVVTKRINEIRNTPRKPLWQRNYFEHIIRNQTSLERIRQYIESNPHNWDLDRENPACQASDATYDDVAWD